ncbi:WXG100 family type VII secretion target [Microbacterium sp. p3-SID338]|uniref:WXG100 family type VII secretion target n=1 Tax=unclassified Microbacterium TaxID=2609290 RepID=UPI0015E072AE|nr:MULTISPECIES: WXG100 family type VII secretion target [unclassified Microbacterium]MCT1395465.1 WXG100 family type VII secretion target [Microbacterium sp. p3-SID338]
MSIELDPERHREFVAALREATETISTELDALDRATRDLRSRWSGSAQSAYDHAQARWVESLERLRMVLADATAAAADAAATLVRADREAEAMWK